MTPSTKQNADIRAQDHEKVFICTNITLVTRWTWSVMETRVDVIGGHAASINCGNSGPLFKLYAMLFRHHPSFLGDNISACSCLSHTYHPLVV